MLYVVETAGVTKSERVEDKGCVVGGEWSNETELTCLNEEVVTVNRWVWLLGRYLISLSEWGRKSLVVDEDEEDEALARAASHNGHKGRHDSLRWMIWKACFGEGQLMADDRPRDMSRQMEMWQTGGSWGGRSLLGTEGNRPKLWHMLCSEDWHDLLMWAVTAYGSLDAHLSHSSKPGGRAATRLGQRFIFSRGRNADRKRHWGINFQLALFFCLLLSLHTCWNKRPRPAVVALAHLQGEESILCVSQQVKDFC